MTQHTPEPWSFEEFSGRHLIHAVGESVSIARAFECNADDGAAEANARRIAACVNACAGIGTEVLESMPINKSYLDVVSARDEWEARAIKEASRAEDLQAQVDELLAALGSAKSALERCYDVTDWPCNGNTDQDKAIAMAMAVINKITGEPK